MPQKPSNLLITIPELSRMRKNIQLVGKKCGTTCFASQLFEKKVFDKLKINLKIGEQMF